MGGRPEEGQAIGGCYQGAISKDRHHPVDVESDAQGEVTTASLPDQGLGPRRVSQHGVKVMLEPIV